MAYQCVPSMSPHRHRGRGRPLRRGAGTAPRLFSAIGTSPAGWANPGALRHGAARSTSKKAPMQRSVGGDSSCSRVDKPGPPLDCQSRVEQNSSLESLVRGVTAASRLTAANRRQLGRSTMAGHSIT